MVEFAIVAGLMMFMTFSIIEFSLIFNAYSTLSQIGRECVRYAAVNAQNSYFDGSVSTAGSLQNYVSTICSQSTISYSDLTVKAGYFDTTRTGSPFTQVTSPTDASRLSGKPITIQITYDMRKKIHVDTSWIPISAFNNVVQRYSTMTIE